MIRFNKALSSTLQSKEIMSQFSWKKLEKNAKRIFNVLGNPEHTDWNLIFWEILILKIYRYTGSSRRSCGVLSANGKRLVEGEHSSSFSLFLTIWNFLRSILPPCFISLHSFFFKVCSDMKRLNSIKEWIKASKSTC